mgnify:FL=1
MDIVKKPTHYVDNKKFNEESEKFAVKCKENRDEWKKANGIDDQRNWPKEWLKNRPQVPDYLGEQYTLIATKISHRPNFSSYSWISDMIANSIENCVRYAHNFDQSKGKAFSYFTRIIWF